MKKFFVTMVVFLASAISVVNQQIATLPDGTKVVLNPDKTWTLHPNPSPLPTQSSLPQKLDLKSLSDDPDELFDTVNGISKQFYKSEFETERQYLARIEKLSTDTKIPSTGHRLSEVVIAVGGLARYDAENSTFTFDTGSFFRKSTLGGWATKTRKYHFSIELCERSSFGGWSTSILGPRAPTVGMPAEKARDLKHLLRLAMFGTPVGFTRGEGGSYTLKFFVTRVVAIHDVTGEIYGERVTAFPTVHDSRIILQ